MNENRKKLILSSIIIVIPMFIGILLWDKLPNSLATHWTSNNIANGWSSKIFAVIGLPLFLLGIHILTIFQIVNDPKGENIGYKMLSIIFWIIPIISLSGCISTYAIALGMDINMSMIGNLLVGILFIVLGNYIPKSKQSYTVGIKLPWTLHSRENWFKTSQLAGKVWVISGICFIIIPLLGIRLSNFVIIIAMSVIPMIYSFILYKKGI